jgi:hypothetical protein
MKDMTRHYKGFRLLNSQTEELTEYPYIKGKDHRDVECAAIQEQMNLTGQPRHDFGVYGFIHK